MGQLKDKLEAMKAGFQEQAPADVMAVMGRAIGGLVKSGRAEKALQVGDALPEVRLPDATGALVDLKDLWSAGPLVLSFYRGGW